MTARRLRLNAVVSRWLSQIGTFNFYLINISWLATYHETKSLTVAKETLNEVHNFYNSNKMAPDAQKTHLDSVRTPKRMQNRRNLSFILNWSQYQLIPSLYKTQTKLQCRRERTAAGGDSNKHLRWISKGGGHRPHGHSEVCRHRRGSILLRPEQPQQ